MEEKKKKGLISPLRNETITVKFIARKRGIVDDKNHVNYGGMHEGSTRSLTVPLLKSGGFVNVLTKDEKAFLEDYMQMEEGALGVHKKGADNFWSDANPEGIGRVLLTKAGTKLDLSDPLDYIRYKILLAHKDLIAPSLKACQENPKATYQFMLVSDVEVSKLNTIQVSNKKAAWMEFGKISEDMEVLRTVIETIEGRALSPNTKLDYLQTKAGELVDYNPALFLSVVKDPLLPTKILINNAIDAGILANRGGFIYTRKDNMPLCKNGQDPTMNVAADYLNQPKNQELKFSIEAQLNNLKE